MSDNVAAMLSENAAWDGAGTEKRHSDRPAENNRRYAAERVSHTVASRETVLTVSAQIDSVCRLLFGEYPNPLKNQRKD